MLVINGRWVTGFWLGYNESSLWSKWELEVLCYSCGLELLLDSEICSYEVLDLALHMAGSSSVFMRLLKHYFLNDAVSPHTHTKIYAAPQTYTEVLPILPTLPYFFLFILHLSSSNNSLIYYTHCFFCLHPSTTTTTSAYLIQTRLLISFFH